MQRFFRAPRSANLCITMFVSAKCNLTLLKGVGAKQLTASEEERCTGIDPSRIRFQAAIKEVGSAKL
jgi:hypothetical protein